MNNIFHQAASNRWENGTHKIITEPAPATAVMLRFDIPAYISYIIKAGESTLLS
jgi:hypothetical protein